MAFLFGAYSAYNIAVWFVTVVNPAPTGFTVDMYSSSFGYFSGGCYLKHRTLYPRCYWVRQAVFREVANESTDGSGSTSSDTFFAVDIECVLHKYRRWHQCFPRVKPFYGEETFPVRNKHLRSNTLIS